MRMATALVAAAAAALTVAGQAEADRSWAAAILQMLEAHSLTTLLVLLGRELGVLVRQFTVTDEQAIARWSGRDGAV